MPKQRVLKFYHDKIFNISNKILSKVVIAAKAAVLSIRADLFKLRNRRTEEIRLGAWRIFDALANSALQSVLQRRRR